MKKLLLIIALISSSALSAQHIGIKGGLNLAKLSIDDVDNKFRYGYAIGGYIHLPIGELLGVQPELLYATKGSRATYDIATIDGESTLDLNYLELPVLAVVKIGDFAEVHGGPYLGYLTNAAIDLDGEFIDEEGDLERDDFRAIDYGFAVGLGVNFGILQVGARYTHGLSRVENSDAADLVLGDAKNRNYRIYAAIRLGLEE
jgi:hypothetical protein